MNLFSYWNSDKMVLRMYGAHEVDEQHRARATTASSASWRSAPGCRCRASTSWTTRSRTPSPPAATRSTPPSPPRPACCSALSREEIAGVMAHELAHVKNRDTLTMTIAATIAGAISMLAQYLRSLMFGGNRDNRDGARLDRRRWLAMIVAPLAAMLVQMAISRTREYAADRGGAEICRQPLWLASALAKIAGLRAAHPQRGRPSAIRRRRISSSSIRCPAQRMDNLFSTHPTTENRIAALEEMAREMGQTARPAR